jgi:hypothetical protein
MRSSRGQHQPLNRQSECYRREGIDLSLSTLADQVGACTTALQPLFALIERHVLTAERLHGDDKTVPIPGRRAGPHRRGSGPPALEDALTPDERTSLARAMIAAAWRLSFFAPRREDFLLGGKPAYMSGGEASGDGA